MTGTAADGTGARTTGGRRRGRNTLSFSTFTIRIWIRSCMITRNSFSSIWIILFDEDLRFSMIIWYLRIGWFNYSYFIIIIIIIFFQNLTNKYYYYQWFTFQYFTWSSSIDICREGLGSKKTKKIIISIEFFVEKFSPLFRYDHHFRLYNHRYISTVVTLWIHQ